MKKIRAFTFILAISATNLFAQQTWDTHKKRSEHGMEHSKKEALKNLNLTDAQQKQLKADNQSFKTKMEALNKDENITVKEQKTRKAALMAEQKAKRNALLTTDQKTKLAADRKALGEKRKKIAQKQADKIQKELELNNEQAVKLKAQNQATQIKVKAIRENTALSADQKKEQMKILRESAMTDHKKILSVEQIQKMEEINKAKKGRHHKKGPITPTPTL